MKDKKFVPKGKCKKTGSGVGVVAGQNESIDSLLARFKKSVFQTGVLEQYKDSMEYTKPSVIRRQKKSRRVRNSKLSNPDF